MLCRKATARAVTKEPSCVILVENSSFSLRLQSMELAILRCCAIASGFLNILWLSTCLWISLLFSLRSDRNKVMQPACGQKQAGTTSASGLSKWIMTFNLYLKTKAIKLFVKVEQTLLHSWGEAEIWKRSESR